MYPKLICDSSSLILLIKSDIIKYILSKNVIVIPKSVYIETVEKGKLKGAEDSYIVERFVEKSLIKVIEPKDKTRKKVKKLCNLHLGERDVIALAIDRKFKVLCDDKKGRNACEVFGIKSATALNILFGLFKKKRINKKQALERLSKLHIHGWYRDSLITHVRDKIGGM